MRQGDFRAAIRVFEELVEIGKAGTYDHWIAYDLRLFTLYPYDALAVCYFRLRSYAESRRYYELALQHDPASLEYRVKLSLCARLARQSCEHRGGGVMPSPLISVIVPTFNRPVELRHCLDGFSRQTAGRDQFEVVIVDDGSTEDTAGVVREFSRLPPDRVHRVGSCGAGGRAQPCDRASTRTAAVALRR